MQTMQTFRVHFEYQGKRQHRDITAKRPNDARREILDMFPGARILKIKVSKGGN